MEDYLRTEEGFAAHVREGRGAPRADEPAVTDTLTRC